MPYKDPEIRRERAREYSRLHERSPQRKAYLEEHREERKEYLRQWRQDNPGYKTNHERLKKYGITPEEYRDLFAAQGKRCGICGVDRPRRDRDWDVDHDHATGLVRGILCHLCNLALGYMHDNPARLRTAADYLEGTTMPHLNPAKGMVMSADVGGGKAIIEIKNPKATLTIELPEDSGWVKVLPEGAIVTYTLDVELPRETAEVLTGPQPGDEIRTHEGIVTIPEPEKPKNIAPNPEEIRLANPIPGFNTIGINANANGESIKDMLGLPSYAPDDGSTKIATATRSSNPT